MCSNDKIDTINKRIYPMKRFFYLISAIIIFTSVQLQAICSYRLIKTPNGKLILVLGDWHNEVLDDKAQNRKDESRNVL